MPIQNGYKYILTVIDIWSKYGWAIPLKTKAGETVKKAFESIINDSNRAPRYLWTDHGLEFYNKIFENYLKINNITLYSTENEGKAVVIERCNQTLKNKMEKQFTIQKLTGANTHLVRYITSNC